MGMKKRLVVTDRMDFDNFRTKLMKKMHYHELHWMKVEEKGKVPPDAEPIEDLDDFEDGAVIVCNGITHAEHRAAILKEERRKRLRAERIARAKEMIREAKERDAKLIDDNEGFYDIPAGKLPFSFICGDDEKNCVVAKFRNRAAQIRYPTIQRGDVVTQINGYPVLHEPFEEIAALLTKAGTPCQLGIISGRFGLVEGWAKEFHKMLAEEEVVVDPWHLLYYENKRAEHAVAAACHAIRTNDMDGLLYFLGHNDAKVNELGIDGSSALHVAVLRGKYKMTSLLLKNGADPNVKDANGASAVHLAAKAGRTDMVRRLISEGADVSIKDSSGRNALHYAAGAGFAEVCDLLLRRGCDPRAVDYEWGWTPLHWAARQGHHKCLRSLLKGGASVYQRSRIGLFAVDIAVRNDGFKAINVLREAMERAPCQRVIPFVENGDGDPTANWDKKWQDNSDEEEDGKEGGGRKNRKPRGSDAGSAGPDSRDDASRPGSSMSRRSSRRLSRPWSAARFATPATPQAALSPTAGSRHAQRRSSLTKPGETEAPPDRVVPKVLMQIPQDSWSVKGGFAPVVGQLFIGDARAAHQEFALSRGFTAIVSILDDRAGKRLADHPYAEWLADDAPPPTSLKPAPKDHALEDVAPTSPAVPALNLDKLLPADGGAGGAAEASGDEQSEDGSASGAGDGDDSKGHEDVALRAADGEDEGGADGAATGDGAEGADVGSEGADGAEERKHGETGRSRGSSAPQKKLTYGDDDSDDEDDPTDPHQIDRMERQARIAERAKPYVPPPRKFIKPAHYVMSARDVDTTTSWMELLKQLPGAIKFIDRELKKDAPPYSSEDIPAVPDLDLEATASKGRVLIWCHSGIRQSPAVLIAYLIKVAGYSPLKAYTCVTEARPTVHLPDCCIQSLADMAEKLAAREAHAREMRFRELRMSSLAGV